MSDTQTDALLDRLLDCLRSREQQLVLQLSIAEAALEEVREMLMIATGGKKRSAKTPRAPRQAQAPAAPLTGLTWVDEEGE